jgi:hypothetical protein
LRERTHSASSHPSKQVKHYSRLHLHLHLHLHLYIPSPSSGFSHSVSNGPITTFLSSGSSCPVDRILINHSIPSSMFEHFTFGAQAQAIHQHEEDISASPTDCSFSTPLLPETSSSSYRSSRQQGGMSDIVHEFSQHSFFKPDDDERPQPSIWQGRSGTPSSPDFHSTMQEFTPENISYLATVCRPILTPGYRENTRSSPPSPTLPCPRSGIVASRRLQRQLNVQLQTSHCHLKDINALVESMIETSAQCRLHKSSPPPSRSPSRSPTKAQNLSIDPATQYPHRAITPDPDEDEGFAEIEEISATIESLRRASTPSGIRKFKALRMKSSAECLNNGKVLIDAHGKIKVRSAPRMRRRKPMTVTSVPE